MSEAAKQVRGEALREKLVDIAAELFYANGVRTVGVDEVVRRAGVGPTAIVSPIDCTSRSWEHWRPADCTG
ncbi:TetR/AcrR family transcriptional regulator [Rhodococcus sp. C26F]